MIIPLPSVLHRELFYFHRKDILWTIIHTAANEWKEDEK